jgi:nicotinate phosphoribosyltransferase
MIEFSGSYVDLYELSMALVYFKKGKAGDQSVFDYFFRKLPFEGGYAVFAGLDDLLDILEKFRFNEKDIALLRQSGFPEDFLKYLKTFRFRGDRCGKHHRSTAY